MARFTYTINDNNEVEFWDSENSSGAPFIHQPVHPNNREWADRDEAKAWADETLNRFLNPPKVDPGCS